jgi:photosystem II stability/assembly factor-like uncharacterized protein
MVSMDGGQSWQNAPTSPPWGNDRIGTIVAIDALTAWAVPEPGFETTHVYRTDDGGQSWTASPSFDVRGLAAFNADTAWIVGHATGLRIAARTADGGLTWTPQSVPTLPGSWEALSAVDASTAWAVGSLGTIIKAVNGGG